MCRISTWKILKRLTVHTYASAHIRVLHSTQYRHIYKYYIWTNIFSVKIHPNQFYICQLIHLPLTHSLRFLVGTHTGTHPAWFHLPPPEPQLKTDEAKPNQRMEMMCLSRSHSRSLSLFLQFIRLVALHCIHNFRNVSISRWPKFGTEQMAFTNGTVIFLNGFRLLRIIICEKYLKQFGAGLG